MRDKGLTADLRSLTSQKSEVGGRKENMRKENEESDSFYFPHLSFPIFFAGLVGRIAGRIGTERHGPCV